MIKNEVIEVSEGEFGLSLLLGGFSSCDKEYPVYAKVEAELEELDDIFAVPGFIRSSQPIHNIHWTINRLPGESLGIFAVVEIDKEWVSWTSNPELQEDSEEFRILKSIAGSVNIPFMSFAEFSNDYSGKVKPYYDLFQRAFKSKVKDEFLHVRDAF